MLIKNFVIILWLLLIGWFELRPLLLRCDDECRRALPSYSVRYAARFYQVVSRLFANHPAIEDISVMYGDLLMKVLNYKINRLRGMAYDVSEADEWEHLLLQHSVIQLAYFLASQAVTYREAYMIMRAENNLQTQLAEEHLADANIFEIMLNVQDYYKAPEVRSEILNYELLTLIELPLLVFLSFNSSDQNPEFFFELKYPCAKFLYEPNVAERPSVVGFYRTPIECGRELNVLNDYTILLRALSSVAREFDELANRSLSLTYSDYFLAIVPPGVLAHAQMALRKLFEGLPSSPVVEYNLIVTTFLRILMNFLYREYDWQRCHPLRLNTTRPAELWKQIDALINTNLKSHESVYIAYVESHNLQNETKALYKSLMEYNIQVGFTLRAGIGAAIADGNIKQKS